MTDLKNVEGRKRVPQIVPQRRWAKRKTPPSGQNLPSQHPKLKIAPDIVAMRLKCPQIWILG